MIDYSEILNRIDAGLITSRKHPTLPLEILNYTQKVQFDKLWDNYTKICRGLILDDKHNIVARPFQKFFNLGETPETMIQNLPNEIPQITEKYDGCFLRDTALNLWKGGTVYMGDVVHKKLQSTLIGMKDGKIVPCEILDWYNNGTKNNWLAITLDCNVSTKSGMGRFTNVLRVTDNHHILINNVFQPIINAKIGDEVTSFELKPDNNIIHTIESGLLGDGSLRIQGKSAVYGDNHKKEHESYTNYIKHWIGNPNVNIKNMTSGFGTSMTCASSKFYHELYEIHKRWYKDGKKIVPEDISWIDDFSVAKWYMDDGNLSHNNFQQDRATFCTGGFTKEDVYRLVDKLEHMYDVNCTVFCEKYPTIRINSGKNNEIDKFWSAIAPHIVPVMRYKLPEKYRSFPYISRTDGSDSIIPTISHIINIKKLENNKQIFPSGRSGFDIKTTTGNYFAKGILVHNSLGILYFDNLGYPTIATRGAFESEQAIWATNFIRNKKILGEEYDNWDFKQGYTYLFEIVCPESKNVVDYKDFQGIVLIAVISNKDGSEIDIKEEAEIIDFPFAKTYEFEDISHVVDFANTMSGTDLEGFVCKYSNGLRVKIKSDDYKRLHKILSGFGEKDVWEALSQGKSLDSMAELVPDEFFEWIKITQLKFWNQRRLIIEDATKISVEASVLTSRKDQAIYIMKKSKDKPKGFSGLIFNILDGKTEQAETSVWNIVKP